MAPTATAAYATRTTSPDTPVRASQPIPAPTITDRPTRDEVVNLIAQEARVKPDVADCFLRKLQNYVTTRDSVNHPGTTWLSTYHHVLETVMRDDDATPALGTAHAAINAHFSTDRRLVTVVHINTSPTKERRGCAVKIERRTVSV